VQAAGAFPVVVRSALSVCIFELALCGGFLKPYVQDEFMLVRSSKSNKYLFNIDSYTSAA
jgi:hypothetical protein